MNGFAFLNQPIVIRLGWTLVHTLWQGVIIAAALAVVLRLLRSAPANLRYLASCAAMAMLVLAAGITFTQMAIPASSTASPARTDDGYVEALPALPTPAAVKPLPPETEPQPAAHEELRWIVLAWAIGVVAMSLWNLAGWLWLARMRRGMRLERWEPTLAKLMSALGIRRAVRLIETSRIDVPAVIGALRPVICVPVGIFSGLSPQQVEAILAHELAHIRRHDYLVNLIQSAIETIYFYHPATWWISAQIRRERENCCDDIATNLCGDRKVYATALAALEGRRVLAPALAATDGDLLNRVRRLLKLPPAHRRNRFHSLAATALAIACVALPLACVTLPRTVNGQQQKNEAPSTVAATVAATTTNPSPIGPQDLEAKVEDYRTGPNDLLSVSITGLVAPGAETVKNTRVSDTGMISLPQIGAIKVAGHTTTELEQIIAKAYRDAKMLDNAQVSVAVTEPRQRTFNILGEIDRPGQYQITQSDFRLLDALTLGGMHSSKPSTLRIIRNEQGGKQRTIEIPGEALAAGDTKVNIVIRPGDTILVAAAPQRFIRIVIGKETLLYQGKPIDWPGIHKLFGDMSEADRHSTVLEIAAASPDVTVQRFFSASGQLSDLVKQYHLAYLSQTGIQPTTEPSASSKVPDDVQATAERLAKNDPLLLKLLNERAATAMQLEAARANLGQQHPRIMEMRSHLARLDEEIAKRADEMTVEKIAQVDATMKEYLRLLDQYQMRFEQLKRSVGPGQRIYQDAADDVRIQQQRINAYADSWKKEHIGATRP